MDISEMVQDSDLGEPYQILRNTGKFAAGGWSADEPKPIDVFGIVSLARQDELQQLPEADRSTEARVFYSVTEMFVTSEDSSQLSDVLVWMGDQYRVTNVWNYVQRGFFKALAVRMAGN